MVKICATGHKMLFSAWFSNRQKRHPGLPKQTRFKKVFIFSPCKPCTCKKPLDKRVKQFEIVLFFSTFASRFGRKGKDV